MHPARFAHIYRRLQQANPSPTTELEHTTPFELLVAVMLSAHTTDKSVNTATRVLFPIANTPQAILAMGVEGVKPYLKSRRHVQPKSKNLIELCRRTRRDSTAARFRTIAKRSSRCPAWGARRRTSS